MALATLGSCAPKDQPEVATDSGFRPYSVRQGQFNFEYVGIQRGYETLWIDSFGHVEARNQHAEEITDKGFRPRTSYSVKRGASVIIVDSVQHRNVRLVDPLEDSLLQLPPGAAPLPEPQFEHFFTNLGYQKTGDTVLAGLPAHVWRQTGVPNYVFEWRGLVVGRYTSTPKGSFGMTLKSFDTTTPVSPSRFIPPKGYPFTKPGEAPGPAQ